MLSFLKRRRRRTLVLMALGALAIPAAALAAWAWSQNFNGMQAQTGNTPTVTLASPTAGDLASAAQCIPGSSCDLVFDVTNPTNAAIKINGFTPSAVGTFGNAGASCAASNFSGPAETTTATNLGTPITVPANAVNFKATWPNALTMSATAPTSCENVSLSQTGGTVAISFSIGS